MFTGKRLVHLAMVLFGVTIISFLLSTIAPVDPAEALALRVTRNPSPEKIEEIRKNMGLDLPLYRQYLRWLGDCLRGDLGTSLLTRNPVGADIARKLPETMKLVGFALWWIVFSVFPVSVIAAVRRDGLFDQPERAE